MSSVGGWSSIHEHDKAKASAALTAPDELPRIGAPATRALADIGITRLSQLTNIVLRTCRNCMGIGPGAMAILRLSLAD
jgi:hypothetical protein